MIALLVALVGLCFGSFITLASYRLPLGEDIVKKPSRCPFCNTKLAARDLVPVLSWCAARGSCRHCQHAISKRYPLIELLTAAAFLLLYLFYGLSLQFFLLALFVTMLLIMIVADFEHYLIPDAVHLVLLPLGIAYGLLFGLPWEAMAAGFAVGLGLGLLLYYGYSRLRKRDMLGFGDVKFLAVAGVWLGMVNIPPFLLISGMLGIVIGISWRLLGRGPVFPFGPALAVSLFICVAFPVIPYLFWNVGLFLQ